MSQPRWPSAYGPADRMRGLERLDAGVPAPFLFILGVPRLQGATAAVVAPLAVL